MLTTAANQDAQAEPQKEPHHSQPAAVAGFDMMPMNMMPMNMMPMKKQIEQNSSPHGMRQDASATNLPTCRQPVAPRQ